MGHLGKIEMRAASVILLIAGTGLCSFGYWGMFTTSGRRAYDEMDGMYPFFALLAGSLMIIVALVFFLIDVRRRKTRSKT